MGPTSVAGGGLPPVDESHVRAVTRAGEPFKLVDSEAAARALDWSELEAGDTAAVVLALGELLDEHPELSEIGRPAGNVDAGSRGPINVQPTGSAAMNKAMPDAMYGR